MRVTQIAIGAGVGFTEIPCTIPAHHVIVRENVAAPGALEAKYPEDSYVTTSVFAAGVSIHKRGNGHDGILARPAGYAAANNPATADLYLKIRRNDGAATTVEVEEHEACED